LKTALRILGKILKVLLVTCLTLVVLLIGAAGVVLKWPEVLINEKNLERASWLAAKFDTVVQWDSAQVEVKSPGLFNKHFLFDFKNLCVFRLDGPLRACFPKLSLAGQVAWSEGFKLLEAGPILIQGATLRYRLSDKEPETQVKKKKNPLAFKLPQIQFPSWLRGTYFKEVQVDFQEIHLLQGEQDYRLGLSLESLPNPQGRLAKIEGVLKVYEVPGIQRGEVHLSLKSPAHFLFNDWNLSLKVDLTPEGGQRIQAEGQVDPQTDNSISFSLKGNTLLEGIQSDLRLSGDLAEGELHAQLQATLAGGMDPIQSIQFRACELDLTPISPDQGRADLRFSCPSLVTLEKIDLPQSDVEKHVRIPTQLSLKMNLQAEAPLTDFAEAPLSGLLKLDFDVVSQELLSAMGDVQVDFAGKSQLPIEQWKLNTLMNVGVKLNDLAKLIKILKGTTYAVWAPLHVLEGTAEFRLKGRLNMKKRKGEVPIEFNTRFFSARQKIDTDGKGKLKFDFSKTKGGADLKMALLLKQLQLVLPNLYIGPIPNLLPDPRFKKPGEAEVIKKNKSPFNYQFSVKTEQDAVLLSNLSQNGKIPFALDLKLTPEKTDGTLTVKQTPVEFFKRVASIEHFDLELADPPNKSRLDGLVRVDYAAYKIKIKVIGSLKRPRFIFESQPPLDQEQIISVLIYGRTFDDLNQSEANNVNSVSSAAAEKALTLGSMYLLASTPIESVAYNPNTQTFTARVRVAKGTAIDLGTQEGKTQEVGLRQKIGGNWFVNTYVENDTETGEQSGGAVLEWSKRY